jgi:hypothetical protein
MAPPATQRALLGPTGFGLYHEVVGQGVPILVIHPSGAPAST